ncbi:MAG: FHA domain-containing protein [Planctomycetota bacterium]|jgi:pSer/pThr/pTyr-binding forkhead associated (FHA) protein
MAALGIGQPVLVMIQGAEPGSLYKLPDNRVSTIGRSSRNTIRVVSPSVSRFHCEVACVNGRWQLADFNSKKGTFINGERVEDRWLLTPGDIIRLATTVFRFDVVDETALQDGAMVAIMEAELDQKLRTKGEASGSLADIRARSRMEGRHDLKARRQRRRFVHKNVTLVGGVAVAVTVIVTGLLAYGYYRAAALRRTGGAAERRAASLMKQAAEALEDGDRAAALEALLSVEREFPGTVARRQAARRRLEIIWAEAEEKLPLATAREGAGDYAGALACYEELDAQGAGAPLQRLLERRRDYTIRLAQAWFNEVDQAARRQVEAGDTEAALRLYETVRARVGVAELAKEASARMAELREGRTG